MNNQHFKTNRAMKAIQLMLTIWAFVQLYINIQAKDMTGIVLCSIVGTFSLMVTLLYLYKAIQQK
jgi:uncharacterized membrane protein